MLGTKNRNVLTLETLEDRLTPSFSAFYNPTGDIWTLTQVQDDGAATIQVDGANTLVVTDGAGSSPFGVALGSLSIRMLDGSTGTLTVDLDGALIGSVSVALGNGARTAFILGDVASIGGNLHLTAGNGAQAVSLASGAAGTTVGGSVFVDLGLGSDTVDAATGIRVGGDMTMRGVNAFDDGAFFVVGRSFNFYTNNETVAAPPSNLTLNAAGAVVGTNLNFIGNNADDSITLNGVTIGGSAYLNLANSIIGSPPSVVNIGTAAATVIGGNLTIQGGTGQESITVGPTATIGGSIYINTGTMGNGTGGVGSGDTVSLSGTIGGGSVQVLTGLDRDSVTYGMRGSNPRLSVMMGLGNDTFTLAQLGGLNPTLSYLYVDFGAGSDVFTNGFVGAFTFPAALRNLP